MANPDQCALAADGSLLDAADITFYNDPDDDAPIPASSSTLHLIFQAKNIAGSRRSVHITRPSAQITDPDNAEALVTLCKRLATVTASAIEASCTARCPKLTSSESDGGESKRDKPERVETSSGTEDDIVMDSVSTEDDEGELAQDALAYHATKAMGDTDRQVCLYVFSFPAGDSSRSSPLLQFISWHHKIDCTADIRTIF